MKPGGFLQNPFNAENGAIGLGYSLSLSLLLLVALAGTSSIGAAGKDSLETAQLMMDGGGTEGTVGDKDSEVGPLKSWAPSPNFGFGGVE